jgi:hypothetical protein
MIQNAFIGNVAILIYWGRAIHSKNFHIHSACRADIGVLVMISGLIWKRSCINLYIKEEFEEVIRIRISYLILLLRYAFSKNVDILISAHDVHRSK